jgi:prophage regulatory protein
MILRWKSPVFFAHAPAIFSPVFKERFTMHDQTQSALTDRDLLASLFLRMHGVTRMTGLGRSTIYRMVAQKMFPAPVRLGRRAVAWRLCDLGQWSAARPLARSVELACRNERMTDETWHERSVDLGC